MKVERCLLIYPHTVIFPPLRIKLGLMKHFGKAHGQTWNNLCGPAKKILKDKNFDCLEPKNMLGILLSRPLLAWCLVFTAEILDNPGARYVALHGKCCERPGVQDAKI